MNTKLADQLPNIAIFLKIVEYNSLQGAATQLHLSRSVVSKKLAQLESHLGERLIQRTTRKLSLTEYGERLLVESQPLFGLLENLESLKIEREQMPSGELNVSCSTAWGRQYVAPLLPEFQRTYPQVHVNLFIEDRIVDLIDEQIDIAIRIGHLPDSSLIAHKLGLMRWTRVASPDYLREKGAPQHPDELRQHRCLTYRNAHNHMNAWHFTDAMAQTHTQVVDSVFSVNDGDALVDLAVAGAGILLIDRALVTKQITTGALSEILTDYQLPEGLPIYAIYPSRKGVPLTTRVFLEFLTLKITALLAT